MGGSTKYVPTTTTTNNTTQTKSDPWSPQQPYLMQGFAEAQKQYESNNPQYFPGSTVVPFSSQTTQGLQQMQDIANNSQLPGQAANQVSNTLQGNYQMSPRQWAATYYNPNASLGNPNANVTAPVASNPFSNVMNSNINVGNPNINASNPFASAISDVVGNQNANVTNPFLNQDPNAYIGNVTQSIADSVVPQVNSAYGAAGRSGTSAGAQSAIARGIADALAPYQFSSAEAAQNRLFQGGESQAGRQFGAGSSFAQALNDAAAQQAARQFQAGSTLAGQQYQSGENQAAREFQGGQQQAQNIYGAGESEAQRAQTAADALAGRQFTAGATTQANQVQAGQNALTQAQAAYEAERARQTAAVGQEPGAYTGLTQPAQTLLDVGQANEGLARQQLQDQIDRWNFGQNVDAAKLAQYMGLIQGNYGGTTSGTSSGTNVATQPVYSNPFMQGLGGALGVGGLLGGK